MRYITRFAVVALAMIGALALPAVAAADHSSADPNNSDCDYASGPMVGPLTVYVEDTDNQSGSAGSADTAAGACMNDESGTTPFQGGMVECGTGTNDPAVAGDGQGTYCVIDGDNANPDPGDGYQGISNYEDGANNTNCPPPDNGANTGTNSGGCVVTDNGVVVIDDPMVAGTPVPTPICGNTSGNTWDNTSRDGCSIP